MASCGLLATNLSLLPRRLQLPVPHRVNLLLPLDPEIKERAKQRLFVPPRIGAWATCPPCCSPNAMAGTDELIPLVCPCAKPRASGTTQKSNNHAKSLQGRYRYHLISFQLCLASYAFSYIRGERRLHKIRRPQILTSSPAPPGHQT